LIFLVPDLYLKELVLAVVHIVVKAVNTVVKVVIALIQSIHQIRALYHLDHHHQDELIHQDQVDLHHQDGDKVDDEEEKALPNQDLHHRVKIIKVIIIKKSHIINRVHLILLLLKLLIKDVHTLQTVRVEVYTTITKEKQPNLTKMIVTKVH
jgi:hypothetical protein